MAGPHSNRIALCKALGISASKISYAAFNTTTLIWSTALTMSVFLVTTNINHRVTVTGPDGEAREHDSAQLAVNSINLAEGRTIASVIKAHLVHERAYIHEGKTYLLRYSDPDVRETKLANLRASEAKTKAWWQATHSKAAKSAKAAQGESPLRKRLGGL